MANIAHSWITVGVTAPLPTLVTTPVSTVIFLNKPWLASSCLVTYPTGSRIIPLNIFTSQMPFLPPKYCQRTKKLNSDPI